MGRHGHNAGPVPNGSTLCSQRQGADAQKHAASAAHRALRPQQQAGNGQHARAGAVVHHGSAAQRQPAQPAQAEPRSGVVARAKRQPCMCNGKWGVSEAVSGVGWSPVPKASPAAAKKPPQCQERSSSRSCSATPGLPSPASKRAITLCPPPILASRSPQQPTKSRTWLQHNVHRRRLGR